MTRSSRFAMLFALLLATLPALAQQYSSQSEYVAPDKAVPHGSAPGMKVKLIAENPQSRDYAVIFSKGDEVLAGLTQFAEQYKVRAAHLTAIGGVQRATIAWFDPQRNQFKTIPINEQSEVASLVGDIALSKGKPVVHIHMVVAGSDGQTRGGHVLQAFVWPTLEVFVTTDKVALVKQPDPSGTGVSLITPDAAPTPAH